MMFLQSSKKAGMFLFLGFFVFITPSYSMAKVSINSECYISADHPEGPIQGTQVNERFELASVSKMFTSFIALHRLGPDHRFETKIYITPSTGNTFDMHIEGSMDPYFGQEMTYFMVSELNRIGYKNINLLTFDENLKINWGVRRSDTQSDRSHNPSPKDVENTLEEVLIKKDFSSELYKDVKEAASKNFKIQFTPTAKLNVKRIEFLEKDRFVLKSNTYKYSIKSAPLYRLLKEMNRYSNNYVADMLFYRLGGSEVFAKHLEEHVGLTSEDIRMINGSGDSVFTSNGKIYNKGSCKALIKTLAFMRSRLTRLNFELSDVMAVSGVEASTLKTRYADLPKTVIAKTGTVNPAVTLSGMLMTQKGKVLFGVLTKTKGPVDWGRARLTIRKRVNSILKSFKGAASINYAPKNFMPFDEGSSIIAL